MLHAAFVRSPHAHARFRKIDGAAARAMPAFTPCSPPTTCRRASPPADPDAGAQPGDPDAAHADCARPRRGLLCRPDRRRRGRDNRYLAEDAAAAVEIDYEPLPAVSDARDAVKPGAPCRACRLTSNVAAFVPMSYGDVEAAFKNAPHVFEEEMHLHPRRGDDRWKAAPCWRVTIGGRHAHRVVCDADAALCRGTLADPVRRESWNRSG
jgi:carbon-monoxide dehydrogenase large subunit